LQQYFQLIVSAKNMYEPTLLIATSGKLLVEIAVTTPFIAFHISMIVFFSLTRPKDVILRNGFYDLFVAVSIVDCVRIVGVSPRLADRRQGNHWSNRISLIQRHFRRRCSPEFRTCTQP
jgi:hypothetical protein